jgi:hypothetical protein
MPAQPHVVRVSGLSRIAMIVVSGVRSMRLFDGNPLGALRHGDYHVAALVPVVDVPVRVEGL